MIDIERRLIEYCQRAILPQYENYDKGHRQEHIEEVAQGAMEIAQGYEINLDMLYTAAIFHDIGLIEGRKYHHLSSARIMSQDSFIQQLFTPEQIVIIAQAIEDHRASCDHEPRSIYGEILSSADRTIDIDTIIIRAYYYRETELERLGIERIIDEIYQHIKEKYGEGGYLRLPILTKRNAASLAELRALLHDETTFKHYALKLIQSELTTRL